MNGWQRLWILLGVIAGVPVMLFGGLVGRDFTAVFITGLRWLIF